MTKELEDYKKTLEAIVRYPKFTGMPTIGKVAHALAHVQTLAKLTLEKYERPAEQDDLGTK